MSAKTKPGPGRPQAATPRRTTTTKVPPRRATQIAVIAKLEGMTIDEAWESVAGRAVEERFQKAMMTAQKK